MRHFLVSSSFLAVATFAFLGASAPALADAAVSAAAISAPTAAIARDATPDWVTLRDLPEATPARIKQANGGTAYLLSDRQIRVRTDGNDEWFRVASKVVERSGLEDAGQLTIYLDPHFETISIHFIHIIRAGKVIDLTPETKFRVVERESELDDGIVSGRLKAMANLRDVQVGDIVDFAYTTHAAAALWPGQFFDHSSLRYSDPLALHAVRYVWPDSMALRMKALDGTPAFVTRKQAGTTEWEWTEQDPPAQKGEDNVPATTHQWGAIDISSMKDWGQLARWGAGLYAGDDSLPADFLARLDAIAAAHPAPADRLTEVTRYLQDSIRYVGEEMGEGSYVPRRPRLVLERGYGDCKDKSLLLAVALRHLGIEAVPALVSTTRGPDLEERLPSPLLFNHVVVRAVLDGKVTWLDATGTHRGGRGASIVPADFGYALPLTPQQGALEKMAGADISVDKMAVLEQFSVDEEAAVPLTLQVKTTYTGERADSMRAYVAEHSQSRVTQDNLDFYHKRFAGLIASKPVELQDDRDANTMVMLESYALPRADFDKDKIATKLITRSYAVTGILPDRQAAPRQQPLALSDHMLREQVIELQAKNRKMPVLDDIAASAAGMTFTRKSEQTGDGVRMSYRLETGSVASVPAKEAESVYALSDQVDDAAGIEYYLDKIPHSGIQNAHGLDEAVLAVIRPDFLKAVELSQKEDQPSKIQALALFTALEDKVKHPSPEAGLVEGMKGMLLAQLGRNTPSLVALRSATQQYTDSPEVFHVWLAMEIGYGEVGTILTALRRTQQAQPAELAKMNEKWLQEIHEKINALPKDQREKLRQDVCIVMADGGWQQNPRTAAGQGMLGCAIRAHSLRGELAQARAGLALAPETNTLVSLAIDRRHQALWPDIDQLGHDGFRKSLERDVERASSASKAAPQDIKLLSNYMLTLEAAGHYDQAIAAGKALATDKARIEVVGEDAFWLVDIYANNLNDAGRTDEALATFDRLLALGVDSYPSLLSMAINHAIMLNDSGHHQQALDALGAVEKGGDAHLSTYGKMWLWAEQACALHALSRPADAQVVEAKMAPHADDNLSAMTRVAACRNDVAAIADLVIKRLKSEDNRDSALGLFLLFDGDQAMRPFARHLHETIKTALATPAVQAEFRQYGRAVAYAGTRVGWSDF